MVVRLIIIIFLNSLLIGQTEKEQTDYYNDYGTIAVSLIEGPTNFFSVTFTNRLEKAFSGSGFTVVERTSINKIIKEWKIQSSGITADNFEGIGELLTADYLISGTVENIDENTGVYCGIKLIDVQSGQIIGVASIDGQIKTKKELYSIGMESIIEQLVYETNEKLYDYQQQQLSESIEREENEQQVIKEKMKLESKLKTKEIKEKRKNNIIKGLYDVTIGALLVTYRLLEYLISKDDDDFDGETVKIDLNYGANLGDNGGFINVTTEYLSRARTLRPSFDWREGYGTASVDGFNFMVNSAMPVGQNSELYAFGGRNFRDTDAYAFTRGSFANGDNRAVPSLYPDGFTPRITSNITDVSASTGVRHNMSNGWKVDFNNTYGKNDFHYYIRGTNNASLGSASPTDFDAGGHTLSQNTTSLDFSKYNRDIKSGFNLAFGLEFRTENFTIFAGEEGSYALYDTLGIALTNPATQVPAVDSNGDQLSSGSQGFPGYSPANAVDRSRTNFGFYLDAELNVSDALLLSGAVRQENYSDFGQTTNYKVAGRYSVSNSLSLRGSVSTGFRAPSLAQKHYNLLFNNIVSGESVRTLLASNTSTVAKAFGIGELTEETAANSSVGFTFNIGELSATVDAYSIAVKDRIVLTDNFDASALNVGAEDAQFFANGVDTKTTGVDIVLNYSKSVGNGNRLSVGLAGNMNMLEIEKINNGALNEFTFFGPFSRAYLEAAAPDYKFGLNLGFQTKKLNLDATITQFSEVILQDFQWIDTPASTQAEADALFAVATDTYEAAMTLDLSAGYSITNNVVLTVGANNLLNTYPTPQYDGWTDQGGFNDSVQMGSDGAYYFSSIGYKF